MKTIALCAALVLAATSCSSADGSSTATSTARTPTTAPAPPALPQDFTWTGRYLVPDLGVEVPFTWHGAAGDFQMVAGGEGHPIHFTNLVHDGVLYTLTYAWPGIPRLPCSNVGAFTLDDLNEGMSKAAFVGHETHHDLGDRVLHHFRSTAVWELPPGVAPIPDVPIRIPLMAGDIYTDADDPTTLRKVLHFGLQNLYDTQLDEWLVIDHIDPNPGVVELPQECADAPAAGEDDLG